MDEKSGHKDLDQTSTGELVSDKKSRQIDLEKKYPDIKVKTKTGAKISRKKHIYVF